MAGTPGAERRRKRSKSSTGLAVGLVASAVIVLIVLLLLFSGGEEKRSAQPAAPTPGRGGAPEAAPSPADATPAGIAAPASGAAPGAVKPGIAATPVEPGPLEEPNSLAGAYTDPAYFTRIFFGAHSHWLQPWRAYLETVPAEAFLKGVGINLHLRGEDPDLIAEMLARHGIANARVEIGWASVEWDDESRLRGEHELRRRIQALKKQGIRPLMLLNAHNGCPGPTRFFERTLAAPAKKGDRTARLTDTGGLVIGRSGFRELTGYWASEVLITAIEGDSVTLSKPLPVDLGEAGKRVKMSTLKYRPFSVPGSDDFNETIAGWERYAGTIARFTADALGTTDNDVDKGFDMEIWNEMSFGSRFTDINHYYHPRAYHCDWRSAWKGIVNATAGYAEAHARDFAGVQFNDGFGNTLPWQASSTEPARIRAIGKHPYAGGKSYPKDEQNGGHKKINALGEFDSYVPTYSTSSFPEYFATAMQTETMVRDMGPITSDIYGTKHGRYVRPGNPCTVWITEVNFAPNENGVTDRDRALALKAKTSARYFLFYLNKGVEKLQLFAASGGDMSLGIVLDSFCEYAKKNTVYPADDAPYVSPALRTIGRMVGKMKEGLDPDLEETRALGVESVSDSHDHFQFEGDGTAAHPPLYNREVLAILPYQVNASRFVVAYYVMTRDVTKDLAPEDYTVKLSGLRGVGARLSVYDPIEGAEVSFKLRAAGEDHVVVRLTATDYPRLLVVDEAARHDVR